MAFSSPGTFGIAAGSPAGGTALAAGFAAFSDPTCAAVADAVGEGVSPSHPTAKLAKKTPSNAIVRIERSFPISAHQRNARSIIP
jgi:hypothetical protein